MAASRTSFDKLQRDRAKKARAAAKREKRFEKETATEEKSSTDSLERLSTMKEGEEIPPDQLLEMVAELHRQFEEEKISFEEFEDRKMELFALISTD